MACLVGCGGAIASGAAVGKVGRDLGAHAQAAPQGAEVCALKEALAASPGGTEKAMSEACTKQLAKDELWRRTIVVLGAYGETLDQVASGNRGDNTGKLEAARTGVQGNSWIQVEGGPETAARDAAGQLVELLSTKGGSDDAEGLVKEAAPHVKTICQGLVPYLDEQARAFGDVEKEIEKRRAAKSDHRCTTFENKSICVGESASDRVIYGEAFGQLVLAEHNHAETRGAVAGFCAAHERLADAASKGNLGDSATFKDVLDAVRTSAHEAPPPPSPPKK
ncbi:MAG TPA: hypothetical protein VGM56_25495 [Byssovorax sp.]